MLLTDKFEAFYEEIESRPEFGLLFDLLEPADKILNFVEFESRDVVPSEKQEICQILFRADRLLEAWDSLNPRAKLLKLIVTAVHHRC